MSARLEVLREDLNSTRSVDRGKLGSLVKIGLVLAGIALVILLLMWSDVSKGRATHGMTFARPAATPTHWSRT